MKRLQTYIVTMITFLVLAMPAFALEGEAVVETPQGLGWMFLFFGLGGVFAIGFIMYAREEDQNTTPQDTQ